LRTVVAAIIKCNTKLLVCQRRRNDSHPLRWEFPGGKVEEGESCAQALVRELREELGVTATIGEEIHRTAYKYNELQNELLLIFFWASVEDSAILQNLVFEKFEWADPTSLPGYDFLPADRELIGLLASGEIRID